MFHLSQEVIYTLALFALKKKKNKEKENCKTAKSNAHKCQNCIFLSILDFVYSSWLHDCSILLPKPFMTLCTGSEEKQGKEWVITSRA